MPTNLVGIIETLAFLTKISFKKFSIIETFK